DSMKYRGAPRQLEDLAPAQWDYVAMGHYHVAHQVEANAWYAGSIEYVAPNPWGQTQDEEEYGIHGKGYLLAHLPAARVEFRRVAAARRHIDLPSIDGKALTGRRGPIRGRHSSSIGRSVPISTGRRACAWVSTTWRASAGRASPDGAAPAPPRELSAARRHRARIRTRDHGHLRTQRLR